MFQIHPETVESQVAVLSVDLHIVALESPDSNYKEFEARRTMNVSGSPCGPDTSRHSSLDFHMHFTACQKQFKSRLYFRCLGKEGPIIPPAHLGWDRTGRRNYESDVYGASELRIRCVDGERCVHRGDFEG